jgi:hypothetical protein
MSGVSDPTAIAETLIGGYTPQEVPAGEVMIAEITEETEDLLQDSVAALKDRRRDVTPCLIGIPGDMNVVRNVAESFEKTLLVAETNRDDIQKLISFLPALFDSSFAEVRGIGSARLFAIDIHDYSPHSGELLNDLMARKGTPLHEIASTPDIITFSAPPAYQDVTYYALSTRAPIASHRELNETDRWIRVAGFTFEELSSDG